jgi:dolichol-phosphate mannosyltransferase
MALKLGFYIVIVSIFLAVYYLIRYLAGGIGVSGFTTLIISLWLIAGILISLIGMVGIYLGRVFDKVKDRPVYIVKEKLNIG